MEKFAQSHEIAVKENIQSFKYHCQIKRKKNEFVNDNEVLYLNSDDTDVNQSEKYKRKDKITFKRNTKLKTVKLAWVTKQYEAVEKQKSRKTSVKEVISISSSGDIVDTVEFECFDFDSQKSDSTEYYKVEDIAVVTFTNQLECKERQDMSRSSSICTSNINRNTKSGSAGISKDNNTVLDQKIKSSSSIAQHVKPKPRHDLALSAPSKAVRNRDVSPTKIPYYKIVAGIYLPITLIISNYKINHFGIPIFLYS